MGILGGLALAFFISWPILVRKLMIPSARPLTDEELAICEKLVAAKRGYPYVCKWALKHKACPCLPCSKLDAQRAGVVRGA